MTVCKEYRVHTRHLEFAVKDWRAESSHTNLPVLALHGWLDNAASFDLMAPKLVEHRVVALDQCGHGQSQHRPAGVPYHFVDYVADAFHVADALGFERFIVLGHSMGANVAATMAAVFPERIAALILIEGFGPVSRPVEQTTQSIRESIEKFSQLESKLKRYAAFSSLLKARLQGRWKLTEEAARLLCERGSVESEGRYSWSSDPRINYSSPSKFTKEQVSAIRKAVLCPTQIVIGNQGIAPELDDWQTPLNEFSHAEIVRMDGYHHLHMEREQVDALAACINDFLKRRSE